MKFILAVHLVVDGNRFMKGGEFTARKEEDIPGVAYSWIRSIKKETGYRKTVIEKVVWNEENDITKEVRKIDEAPLI